MTHIYLSTLFKKERELLLDKIREVIKNPKISAENKKRLEKIEKDLEK